MRLSWIAGAAMLAGALIASAAVAQDRAATPDILFVNGKIYTGAPGVAASARFVEAVAVKDGRVIATGKSADLKALASPRTQVQDLGGKTVLPGFYDSHVHVGVVEARTRTPTGVDLEGLKDLADLKARLRAYAASLPSGVLIRGMVPHGNGGHEPLPEDALPTAKDLDDAVPDKPVALKRGHSVLANTMALRGAGITRATPQPRGGWIQKDAAGEPTGVLRERAAAPIYNAYPLPPLPDDVALSMMRARLAAQLPLGVTSLNIPGLRVPEDLRWAQMLYSREGKTLPRVTMQVRPLLGQSGSSDPAENIKEAIAELESLSFHTGFGDDRIKLGAIKFSVDGAFSGQAAWLIDEYPGRPDFHGAVSIPPDMLYPVAKRAHELGWQLGIHVIGDEAVVQTVDVLDRILKESPRPDARHYLHHISVKPPQATLDTMVRDGIWASMQPNLTYTIANYYKATLTPAKAATNNPQRSLQALGIPMGYGTDNLPDGPLVAIYAAVTRRGVDGQVYGPEERVSLTDAIGYATLGTARLMFDDADRGSLEVGKLADLIVLEDDIFSIDPERIRTLRVLQTVIGGDTVWRLAAKP